MIDTSNKNTVFVHVRQKCWQCRGLGYKIWHGTGWLARHTHGKCDICHGTGRAEEWIAMDSLLAAVAREKGGDA